MPIQKPKIKSVVTKTFKGMEKTVVREDEDGIITQTKTISAKRNPKKVVLDSIGQFELYCYPYDYPDQLFFGTYPNSEILDKQNLGKLIRLFNIARWFLKGDWTKTDSPRTEGAKARQKRIFEAYGRALDEIKERKKPNFKK